MKFRIAVFFLITFGVVSTSFAQARDYLSDEEIELVRDAQQIDKRIEVLTHAIDRRFAALKIDVSAPAVKEKPDVWGATPTGTRQQLLYDIRRILQKAIDDIDNLSDRPTSMVVDEPTDKKKKPDGFNELFPRAVHLLAAAAERYKTPLKTQLNLPGGGSETGSILDALDMCDEITAAATKLPKQDQSTKQKDH